MNNCVCHDVLLEKCPDMPKNLRKMIEKTRPKKRKRRSVFEKKSYGQ